jgi:uncharacterized protein YcfJ
MAIRTLLKPLLLSQAVLLATLGVNAAHSGARDEARVVDVNPVYETVRISVPREECAQERVPLYGNDGYRKSRSHSSTPGLVGAIIGGAIGNSVGHNKTNKRVGLAVGALLGGAIGSDIAKKNRSYGNDDYRRNERRYTTQQVCTVYDDWQSEEQVTGYDVSYVYAGETYVTRMDTRPGDTINVNVRVTPVY